MTISGEHDNQSGRDLLLAFLQSGIVDISQFLDVALMITTHKKECPIDEGVL